MHPTHYGRICPIETPEGPNIGLINSLATYARVNQYGFIETPYRVVKNGKVTDEVVYMSAMDEGRYTVAQANAELDAKGKPDRGTGHLPVRRRIHRRAARGHRVHRRLAEADRLGGRGADSVPGERRRQPRPDGLEHAAPGCAADPGRGAAGRHRHGRPLPAIPASAIVAKPLRRRRPGRRDPHRRPRDRGDDDTETGVDIYNLPKFQRSNQNTCINQRPLVKVGDRVEAGDIIADGPSTHLGELALGRNVLVAFMPWQGYNFEDSILISERIVRDDVFTSIHIEEFEVMARDTKLGQEEITRDIPNVGEEALKNLDEAGIVYIGAE